MSNVVKEFESRAMLTFDEYMNVVSFYMKLYPEQQFLQNTNIYFDSDDLFLRKNHITLRIRTINDVKCELTAKIKGENGDQEINDDLSFKEMDTLINQGQFPEGNVKKFLLSLSYPLSSYKQIVTLYNRRLEIKYDDHLLVIDKNIYNDITDYNLEVEAEKDISVAKEKLANYIQKFHLTLFKQKYVGKAHRAIMSTKNQG